MRHGVLTRYVENGYTHLKQVTGLPEGLLDDFSKVAVQLGDTGIKQLAEPLGLKERLEAALARAPDPGSLPDESWQKTIQRWEPASAVLPVTMKLLRACERIEALDRKGALAVDFSLIRGLAVIAYAPFAPGGNKLLNKLAVILGGDAAEPAVLLDRYITAVTEKETTALGDIDRTITENPAWRQWSEGILSSCKDFPFLPRVIGISPLLGSAAKQVIVDMLMEVSDADNS
jgi:hypothetical protein